MFYKSHDPKNPRIEEPQKEALSNVIVAHMAQDAMRLEQKVSLVQQMADEIAKWASSAYKLQPAQSKKGFVDEVITLMERHGKEIEEMVPNLEILAKAFANYTQGDASKLYQMAQQVEEGFALAVRKFTVAESVKNVMLSEVSLEPDQPIDNPLPGDDD